VPVHATVGNRSPGEAPGYAQRFEGARQRKIGVIYQNDDYGQDYLDGLLGTRLSRQINQMFKESKRWCA
jgi:hypothetical protein